jgi:hypothetical protein
MPPPIDANDFIVSIIRKQQDQNQTLGFHTVEDQNGLPLYAGLLLERGWRDNQKRISCVPIGEYELVWEYSNRFKCYLWEVKGVENRTETKFHTFNFWFQSNGCYGPGRTLKDINKDGYYDITASKSSLAAFHKAMGGQKKARLIITNDLCKIKNT